MTFSMPNWIVPNDMPTDKQRCRLTKRRLTQRRGSVPLQRELCGPELRSGPRLDAFWLRGLHVERV